MLKELHKTAQRISQKKCDSCIHHIKHIQLPKWHYKLPKWLTKNSFKNDNHTITNKNHYYECVCAHIFCVCIVSFSWIKSETNQLLNFFLMFWPALDHITSTVLFLAFLLLPSFPTFWSTFLLHSMCRLFSAWFYLEMHVRSTFFS